MSILDIMVNMITLFVSAFGGEGLKSDRDMDQGIITLVQRKDAPISICAMFSTVSFIHGMLALIASTTPSNSTETIFKLSG